MLKLLQSTVFADKKGFRILDYNMSSAFLPKKADGGEIAREAILELCETNIFYFFASCDRKKV